MNENDEDIKLWYVNLENHIFGLYKCKPVDTSKGHLYIPELDVCGTIGVNLFVDKAVALNKLSKEIDQEKDKMNRFYQECLDQQ